MSALKQAFLGLKSAVEEQCAAGEDAQAVQDALNGTVLAGTPLVDELAAAFGGLVPQLNAVERISASVSARVTEAGMRTVERRIPKLMADRQTRVGLTAISGGHHD